MNRGLFIALIGFVFLFSFYNYCIAGALEDAKEALIKTGGAFSGVGAEISGSQTILEIEKKSIEEMSKCKTCPQVPFGYSNKDWERFKAQYREGDIILYFNTNHETWSSLMGSEGYALIRAKEVIDRIIIKEN